MRPVFVRGTFVCATAKAVCIRQRTEKLWFPKKLIEKPKAFDCLPGAKVELVVGDMFAINRAAEYEYCHPETCSDYMLPSAKRDNT